jgi:hypothetical protein
MKNKVHLRVNKDDFNKWFSHSNRPSDNFPVSYKLQLKGDTRIAPTFLEQCATSCNLPNFMRDFDTILSFAEKNHLSLFTLYVSQREDI